MTEQTPTPAPDQPEGAEPDMRTLHDAAFADEGRRWGDNLDLLKSLFLGMLCTALFYEVFPIPFLDQGRVLALFQNDNWVSPVIVGMTFWSFFLLMFKFFRFRYQHRVWQRFRSPAVAQLLNRKIYARDADRVISSLNAAMEASQVRKYNQSIVYRRVLRLLYFLRGASSKEGLDNLLDYQGQIDLKKLETSYTVVQVFIWAIPILGFIGTVMGIGFSVSEFAQFIQSAEAGGEFNAQMRSALGGVTSGLAVAFNTTFLALVLVIPVMLVTSFLHKVEEEFLLTIEEFCLGELLPLLHVTPGETALAEGFDQHLNRILRLSDTWLGQFEPLVTRLSQQAEMMSHQLTGIQPLIMDFTDRLLRRRPTEGGAQPAPPSTAADLPEREEDPPPQG